MIELTPELIRKHRELIEAKITVRGHTKRSKKGKAFNVRAHDREVERLRQEILKLKDELKQSDAQIIANANAGGRDPSLGLPDNEFVAGYRQQTKEKISDLRKQMDRAAKATPPITPARGKAAHADAQARADKIFGSDREKAVWRFGDSLIARLKKKK